MAHLPLTLVAIGGIILWFATIAFYVVFIGSLFGRRLETPVPIPFAHAFGGKENYAPLARVLEHLGLLTLFTAVVTLAAYIPIFWPFVANITVAHGWKVW
jgi:cytochrome c oxidase subunit 1